MRSAPDHLVPAVVRRTIQPGLVLSLVLTLSACGATGPGDRVPFDPDSTEPLSALPPCAAPPTASADPPVEGLLVPDGMIVTEVVEQGPLTSVAGYLPLTPIQIRTHYQDRTDIEVIVLEDEVYEAEVLVAGTAHRMYLKAGASCDAGSTVQAVVAPEVDAEGLPVPAGVQDQLPAGS